MLSSDSPNSKTDQIDFVNSLLEKIRETIQEEISSGNIPARWSGSELREYIHTKTANPFPMDIKRHKEFRNDVMLLPF